MWPILSLLVSIFFGVVGYWLGHRNASIAARTLALNIKKATPHISSRSELRMYNPSPSNPNVRRLAVHATIYNDGDLIAGNIEGECSLTIEKGKQPITKIIRADSLSATFPWETDLELSGDARWYLSRPDTILQVDIDLVYVALGNQAQHYRARYHYDHNQSTMIADKLD